MLYKVVQPVLSDQDKNSAAGCKAPKIPLVELKQMNEC